MESAPGRRRSTWQLSCNFLLKIPARAKLSRRMEIIHAAAAQTATALPPIRLAVDRLTLAKRRWRGVAEDGREFGFDLTAPLRDGDIFFTTESAAYVLAQKYEPVLEVSVAAAALRDGARAARMGWLIGNLHFLIEVTAEVIRVVDDPAVRQMFEREGIAFTPCKRVFHPISGGHQH
jgi:urease accessory protein